VLACPFPFGSRAQFLPYPPVKIKKIPDGSLH
jgi:hypothetical protein